MSYMVVQCFDIIFPIQYMVCLKYMDMMCINMI